MACGCEGCGRLLVDGRWGYFDMAPRNMGLCPSCGHLREETQRLMYEANVRRTRRRLAHKEPWAPGTTPDDPFQGFRDGDKA